MSAIHAAVFAADPYLAEDAANAVFCDIEELNPRPIRSPTIPVFPETAPELLSEPAVIHKGSGDLDAASRALTASSS